MDHTTLSLITIPLFTGAIGYVTNLSGVWMLFYPVRFAGVRVPGLAPLANVMPRRIQQIPGLGQGGLGWQGIVPSQAAKMGSIAVDKGLSKVGGALASAALARPAAARARRRPRPRRGAAAADSAPARTRIAPGS